MVKFAPQSPSTGDKRKRPDADSALPARSTVNLVRFSPPNGHRQVQAMAHHDSMPFLSNGPSESAPYDQASPSGGSDTSHHHNNPFQARPSEPLPSKPTRLSSGHSSSQAQPSRANNKNNRSTRQSTLQAIEGGTPVQLSSKSKARRGENPGTEEEPANSVEYQPARNRSVLFKTPLGKPYNEFEDGSYTCGALIPDEWERWRLAWPSYGPDLPFPCPVRDCHKLCHGRRPLGYHFNVSHRKRLLHDNLDGTLSVIGPGESNGMGSTIISRGPPSHEAGPPAETRLGTPIRQLSPDFMQDAVDSSSTSQPSVRIPSPSNAIEDQQADNAKRKQTTLDSALEAYPCLEGVKDTVVRGTSHDVITFLANLPAVEGALDINPAPNGRKGKVSERAFEIKDDRRVQVVRLKAALAQSHGIMYERPCADCASAKGLWKICMQAPTMPGEPQDVFKGACPSCFYATKGHKCDRRNEVVSQGDMESPPPAVVCSDIPLQDDHRRRRTRAAPDALVPHHLENDDPQGNKVPTVSADEKDSQDPRHDIQDQAFNFARRARKLPLEKRQAIPELVDSLLSTETLELGALDMVRRVHELPHDERAQTTKMILQILRIMLE